MSVPLPPFEKNLARAHTLPARCYTDPEIFTLERERNFARTWQPVARLEQLQRAGDFLATETAGEPLVLVRDGRGDLRAFSNVCRHRAGSVAEGCGNRQTLQCSYHGWTYSLDGRLLGTPEFEGVEEFDRQCFGLVPVRVATFGPFIFVNLDTAAPPLEAILGPILEQTEGLELQHLRFCERRIYDIACNWKVYVDNYLEGYHLPTAHPGLFRELDYARYRVETHRFHSLQHAPFRASAAASSERLYESDSSDALYYWIFPNWMLNAYPDNVSLNIVVPLTAERTRTVFEWYVPASADAGIPESVSRSIAFGEQTQVEDIALCEAVQTRLHSRTYDRGRFSVKRENGVHHFQGLVSEFLTSNSCPVP
jgi:phenylpropionate dioxygenase-like ring-hydroxylating dioxygenase large terminal subunit